MEQDIRTFLKGFSAAELEKREDSATAQKGRLLAQGQRVSLR